jgi:hypothetical protein
MVREQGLGLGLGCVQFPFRAPQFSSFEIQKVKFAIGNDRNTKLSRIIINFGRIMYKNIH